MVDTRALTPIDLMSIASPAADPPLSVPTRDVHRAAVLDVGGRSLAELEELVGDFGPEVVRAKGIVHCCDVDELIEVHVVGARRELRRRPDLERATDRLVVVRI